jgi:hypothetical protein
MMKTPATILIDDIGEGLDFDRSSRLIKLLIEIAEKNENIRLIMSTNDRFVMNAVPEQPSSNSTLLTSPFSLHSSHFTLLTPLFQLHSSHSTLPTPPFSL